MQHWGFLYFQSKGHPYAHRIDVYRAYDWAGEPTEYVGLCCTIYCSAEWVIYRTEEMRPEWFDFRPHTAPTDRASETAGEAPVPAVPWNKMWEDDKFWLPLIWDRRKFVGRADFSEFGDTTKGAKSEGDGASMLRWWFATVTVDPRGD